MHFKEDLNAVNTLLDYMISFVLAMMIFLFFASSYNSLLLDTPKGIVGNNQLIDVGNDIGTKLMDTYIVAPTEGMIETNFVLPEDAAGYDYEIEIKNTAGQDKEVIATITDRNLKVSLTLNGISSTIPISGYTSSTKHTHTIKYKTR